MPTVQLILVFNLCVNCIRSKKTATPTQLNVLDMSILFRGCQEILYIFVKSERTVRKPISDTYPESDTTIAIPHHLLLFIGFQCDRLIYSCLSSGVIFSSFQCKILHIPLPYTLRVFRTSFLVTQYDAHSCKWYMKLHFLRHREHICFQLLRLFREIIVAYYKNYVKDMHVPYTVPGNVCVK
jgi:hypothetical protein